MSLRETIGRTDWVGVIIASVFLFVWLHLGRWLTGQPQFSTNITGLASGASITQLVGPLLVNLGLCFLGTLMLAWIQIRRQPEDLVGAALLGVLAAVVPVAFLVGDASRLGKLDALRPGILIVGTGIVATSLFLYVVRNR